MLEPISLGQARTHCPGLAADERGVVMGRSLALFFIDLPRTVSFFRSFSRELSLDEIYSSLEIKQVKGETGGQEIMVRFDVAGSNQADRAAQAARMHKGRVFTGTTVHFVPYRDKQSPMGYDLATTEELVREEKELVLYTSTAAELRKMTRVFKLREIILALSPRPLSNAERETEQNASLVLSCPDGLAKEVCRYLWQRQISATVTRAVSGQRSLFTKKNKSTLLFWCEQLPKHIIHMLRKTPGLKVFVPVQPHILVEWGYRHPIVLESCSEAFGQEQTVLFHGPPSEPELILVDEESTNIGDLIDVNVAFREASLDMPKELSTEEMSHLQVDLKLGPLPHGSAPTQGLLIPIDRLNWFTKLVYWLPSAVLRTYECVIAPPYIVVINRRGVHGIPFGIPMTEAYPQIFVPVGMQLLPKVDYELLRDHFQIRPNKYTYFFLDNEEPFSVATDSFHTLSRAIVAQSQASANVVEIETQGILEGATAGRVRHRRQGVFSLWRGASWASAAPTELAHAIGARETRTLKRPQSERDQRKQLGAGPAPKDTVTTQQDDTSEPSS